MKKSIVWNVIVLSSMLTFSACNDNSSENDNDYKSSDVPCDAETFVIRCSDDNLGVVKCSDGVETTYSCNNENEQENRCVDDFLDGITCSSPESKPQKQSINCYTDDNGQPVAYEWYQDSNNNNVWVSRQVEITEDALCLLVNDDNYSYSLNRLIKPSDPRNGITILKRGEMGCYKNHAYFNPTSSMLFQYENFESKFIYVDCGDNYRCDNLYGCLPPCSLNQAQVGDSNMYEGWSGGNSESVTCRETNGNYTNNNETLYYSSVRTKIGEAQTDGVLFSDFDTMDNPKGESCDANTAGRCFGDSAINCVDGIYEVNICKHFNICREITEGEKTVAKCFEPCAAVDEGKRLKACNTNDDHKWVSTTYECRKRTKTNGITEWYLDPIESSICENNCSETHECQ